MGLVELPSELQLAIIEQLPSITHLTRVHPRLRETVESLLYTDITFNWISERPVPGAMLLLRTLLERPDLAHHIRTINLRCDGQHHLKRYGPIHQLEPLLLTKSPPGISEDRLLGLINTLGFADEDIVTIWIKEIRRANSDAVIALIVALAPNISQLSLSEAWGSCYDYLSLVFRKALCPSQSMAYKLPNFDQLTSVSLTPRFQYQHIIKAPKEDDILALFYLPRIRNLTLPIASRRSMTWPDETLPRPETLMALGIYRLREKHLGTVLAVCPSLESLHYMWLYRRTLDRPLNRGNVVLDDIAVPIAEHCSSTLKRLKLDAHTETSYGDGEDPPIKVTGSLAALKQLHHIDALRLPWGFVYGTLDSPSPDGIRKVVPESARYLQLEPELYGYEEYLWTSDEIIGLIRGELHSGLSHSKGNLEGIRLLLPYEYDATEDGNEPEDTELYQLRAENFDVEVYDAKPSIYIKIRKDAQEHGEL